MTQRVAFIIESSHRMEIAPAHQFYRGPKARWMQAILEYLDVRNFPQEDIFFLSFYQQRIIGYHDMVTYYPVGSAPSKQEREAFANKIYLFLQERYPIGTTVELHAGKSITDFLIPLLVQGGYPYVVYGESVPLAKKAVVYQELIQEEKALRRLKERQRERISVVSLLAYRSPAEAEEVVSRFHTKAGMWGVEGIFQELKNLLRTYKQQVRHAEQARDEFYQFLQEEPDADALEQFFSHHDSLAKLLARLDVYERVKQQHGKLMAKFTRYLIKHDYVCQTENRIGEALLRLQIALLK